MLLYNCKGNSGKGLYKGMESERSLAYKKSEQNCTYNYIHTYIYVLTGKLGRQKDSCTPLRMTL